ncbi:MAG: calcium-translocating P-type ATPase, PMCA-type [Clostridia bacterium]|nr:calcium-translocating P-type ATPase, PMCA-type [Clostridia bacterium]
MQPYLKNPNEVLSDLGCDLSSGLTDTQIKESAEKHGINEFTREKPPSFLARIVESCKEPMILLLIFAGIIAIVVNAVRAANGGHFDVVECVGIFVAIALSVMISVIMESRSAKAFEALNRMKQDIQVKVLRNGKIQLIPQSELVVGDIVYVETGDKLSADGRLIESTALRVDESSLTGESVPVKKDAEVVLNNEKTPVADRVNMLYSGTFVTGGSGVMVVTAVGDKTEFGKIARELTSVDSTSTPLQEKLAKLGKIIAILGIFVAIAAFILQLVTFSMKNGLNFENISEAFITSIVLIVACVPEGLPTIVAVSLALNVIKMSKRNALVKKLVASETIGCINVICSDKTGTLTENRMTVVEFFNYLGAKKPEELTKDALSRNFAINSTANVEFYDNRKDFIGNPTECALLVALSKAGLDYRTMRSETSIVHVYPFSSEKKKMTTVIKADDFYVAYTKGAPEKILTYCDLSDDDQARYEDAIRRYQSKAHRVIGFAHKEFTTCPDFDSEREIIESHMVFDGFVAITDPLRSDVYDAVVKARGAGISLKMLTGDNIVTATAIANQLGILDDDHIAVEANTIEEMNDDELKEAIPHIAVIARSTPVVKMRVVNTLKELGNVVAVTGDGINDAPALKNADIGIAMGITGTEVSKEASDVVLIDDSFTTIVRATEWGRGIFDNFMRFIQFQLTVNVSSVIVVLGSIIAGFASPFSALQLLWINLIMDGPPALTLGLEPMRRDLMKRAPTPRNQAIVSSKMLTRIVVNGIYVAVVILLQHFTNFLGGTTDGEKTSIIFSLFVVFQLFNAFNSRELENDSIFKNLFRNKLMFAVFTATFVLQFVITQFGGSIFGTAPLSLVMWGKILLCGASIIILGEIVRFIGKLISRK